jgi:NADPH:quinone reductase-like Zn-dependent oxidoreductase
MKAVSFDQHGGPEVLRFRESPDPRPRADEALIEVKACALNHLDIWIRRGLPGIKVKLPHIGGCDIAGVVRETGELVDWITPGARVLINPGTSCGHCQSCLEGADNLCPRYDIIGGYRRDGGLAELVAVPGANLIPMPENLDFNQAAALPLVFLTAWHMLVARAQLKPGEDVLVHAAGSGVGSAAIQIARLIGARVIATASSEAKLQKARELGAHETINYREQDFAEQVKRLTDRKGVEVVFEHTGEETWEGSILSLAREGRLVTCGATTGYQGRTDLRHVFFRQLTIYGSTMGSKAELLHLMKFFRTGELRPVIDRILPLEAAIEAQRAMEERAQFGKIVLNP